jgi:hypothetical protein
LLSQTGGAVGISKKSSVDAPDDGRRSGLPSRGGFARSDHDRAVAARRLRRLEAAAGAALLIGGLATGSALYAGGGMVLLAIAARTTYRRRAALRLARMGRPDRPG